MRKRRRAIDPRCLTLPVAFGRTDEFDAVVERTRDFVRFRETLIGPWLFVPEEHGGMSLWEWNADQGLGDSCRDSQILDEYVELVFAYDPLSRMVGVAPYVPSMRSVLANESVIVNQILSFIAAHLCEPGTMALVRSRFFEGTSAKVQFMEGGASAEGGGAATGFDELDMMCAIQAVDDDEVDLEEDKPLVITQLSPPATFDRVADWLEVLTDSCEGKVLGPIRTSDELHARLDLVGDVILQSHKAPHPSVFRMTTEALLARVIERTNVMRRLYGRLESRWPEIPSLYLGYPTATVTVCVGTPALCRTLAEYACERCDGCSQFSPDHTPSRQLAIPGM